MSSLFVVQEIPDRDIPEEMKIYTEKTERKTVKGTRKKKQLGDTAKLKENSFYGKMIEDLSRHKSTKFTCEERSVDKALRFPFFDNLEEIGGTMRSKRLSKVL